MDVMLGRELDRSRRGGEMVRTEQSLRSRDRFAPKTRSSESPTFVPQL